MRSQSFNRFMMSVTSEVVVYRERYDESLDSNYVLGEVLKRWMKDVSVIPMSMCYKTGYIGWDRRCVMQRPNKLFAVEYSGKSYVLFGDVSSLLERRITVDEDVDSESLVAVRISDPAASMVSIRVRLVNRMAVLFPHCRCCYEVRVDDGELFCRFCLSSDNGTHLSKYYFPHGGRCVAGGCIYRRPIVSLRSGESHDRYNWNCLPVLDNDVVSYILSFIKPRRFLTEYQSVWRKLTPLNSELQVRYNNSYDMYCRNDDVDRLDGPVDGFEVSDFRPVGDPYVGEVEVEPLDSSRIVRLGTPNWLINEVSCLPVRMEIRYGVRSRVGVGFNAAGLASTADFVAFEVDNGRDDDVGLVRIHEANDVAEETDMSVDRDLSLFSDVSFVDDSSDGDS
jgi:hypothetical protein